MALLALLFEEAVKKVLKVVEVDLRNAALGDGQPGEALGDVGFVELFNTKVSKHLSEFRQSNELSVLIYSLEGRT